ncbi:hypothetical protein [Marinobacter sp. SS21]|uniref:hypothetical protein n=1 Tax=Marinobacter sp. SS21 TaxID=2979460 RepID=UPI002330F313|nr:hypothetical protein [Marinobacter sp. SS21]MDC0664363.1 hypothetical protein [Marinobacter sp. SS21]
MKLPPNNRQKSLSLSFQSPVHTFGPSTSNLRVLFLGGLHAWADGDYDEYARCRDALFEMGFKAPLGLAARVHSVLCDVLRELRLGRTGEQPSRNAALLTFQGSAHCAPIPALEGLFTTLSQRLEQLRELNTDLPGDYVDRCKSAFTDALLIELERQGYHSPEFDRLLALRDAWDNGTLTPNSNGSTPHEHQEETVHAAVHRYGRLPGTAAPSSQQGNPENPRGVRGRSPELGHRATSHPDRDITPCCVAAPVIRHRRYEGDRHSTTGLQGGPQGQRSGPCGPGGLCHIGDRRR